MCAVFGRISLGFFQDIPLSNWSTAKSQVFFKDEASKSWIGGNMILRIASWERTTSHLVGYVFSFCCRVPPPKTQELQINSPPLQASKKSRGAGQRICFVFLFSPLDGGQQRDNPGRWLTGPFPRPMILGPSSPVRFSGIHMISHDEYS